jgi:hypothetical protein
MISRSSLLNGGPDFFIEIHNIFQAGSLAEDIDVTHRRVLDALLEDRPVGLDLWDDTVRNRLIAQ